jgi:hypothetical protein
MANAADSAGVRPPHAEASEGLRRTLRFADGFALVVLACPGRLEALRIERDARRETRRRGLAWKTLRAEDRAAVEGLGGAIRAASAAVGASSRDGVLWIEARFRPGEPLAVVWDEALRRLNETRNDRMREFPWKWVLSTTPEAVPLIVRAAPDWWSVRTEALVVNGAAPPFIVASEGEPLLNIFSHYHPLMHSDGFSKTASSGSEADYEVNRLRALPDFDAAAGLYALIEGASELRGIASRLVLRGSFEGALSAATYALNSEKRVAATLGFATWFGTESSLLFISRLQLALCRPLEAIRSATTILAGSNAVVTQDRTESTAFRTLAYVAVEHAYAAMGDFPAAACALRECLREVAARARPRDVTTRRDLRRIEDRLRAYVKWGFVGPDDELRAALARIVDETTDGAGPTKAREGPGAE